MIDRFIKLAYENPKLRRPILTALWSERRAALGQATVNAFLAVLKSKITQWNKRYNKRNPYALGTYLGVVQDLEKKLSGLVMKDDEDSLTKLKQMMQRHFDPQFPPVKATVKQIDAYLAKGTMPSLTRRATKVEKDMKRAWKLALALERKT